MAGGPLPCRHRRARDSPSAAAAGSSGISPRLAFRPAKRSTPSTSTPCRWSPRRRSWPWPPATVGSARAPICSCSARPAAANSISAAAIGLALVENGWRVLFTRTTDLVQKLQIARRDLQLEAAIDRLDQLRPPDPRRPRLRQQGPGRDQRVVRAHQRALRTAFAPHHGQPAVRRLGQDLPRQSHDTCGGRPPRPPRHDLRDERRKLSPTNRAGTKARARTAAVARDTQNSRVIDAPRQSSNNSLPCARQSTRNHHLAATPDLHPDCRGPLIQIVALQLRGRQTKFTPERMRQVVNLVERGKSREEIAELVGVTVGTLQVTCSTLGISLRNPGSTPERVICGQAKSAPAMELPRPKGSAAPRQMVDCVPQSPLQPPPAEQDQIATLHPAWARTYEQGAVSFSLRMQYRGEERTTEILLTQDMIGSWP